MRSTSLAFCSAVAARSARPVESLEQVGVGAQALGVVAHRGGDDAEELTTRGDGNDDGRRHAAGTHALGQERISSSHCRGTGASSPASISVRRRRVRGPCRHPEERFAFRVCPDGRGQLHGLTLGVPQADGRRVALDHVGIVAMMRSAISTCVPTLASARASVKSARAVDASRRESSSAVAASRAAAASARIGGELHLLRREEGDAFVIDGGEPAVAAARRRDVDDQSRAAVIVDGARRAARSRASWVLDPVKPT